MLHRYTFHNRLKEFCENVYFQPPSNILLKYPCIVYKRSGYDVKSANDSKYLLSGRYDVTVISSDPDSALPMELLSSFNFSRITNSFTLENLHHTTMEIFI